MGFNLRGRALQKAAVTTLLQITAETFLLGHKNWSQLAGVMILHLTREELRASDSCKTKRPGLPCGLVDPSGPSTQATWAIVHDIMQGSTDVLPGMLILNLQTCTHKVMDTLILVRCKGRVHTTRDAGVRSSIRNKPRTNQISSQRRAVAWAKPCRN